MNADTVLLRFDGHIAEIAFNRPEKKNSLRPAELELLAGRLTEVEGADARCLLLRGEGGAFSAGRDIGGVDPATDDAEGYLNDLVGPVLQQLRRLPLPTVALVEGPCLGIGFGLACACDIVLAADDALFGSPFRNIGAVLDSGGHYHLRQRVGVHRAFEMIYTGRLIRGREAAALGLVNHSYPWAELQAEARSLARALANGPTAAFRISKRILLSDLGYDDTLAQEAQGQAEALRTADAREGFAAFREKRPPKFIGR